uniref:Uncharacterized protein n=1 Tax=Anopheles arabiensis TaxID=7173 RepID=A0A182IEW0_ANOAR
MVQIPSISFLISIGSIVKFNALLRLLMDGCIVESKYLHPLIKTIENFVYDRTSNRYH